MTPFMKPRGFKNSARRSKIAFHVSGALLVALALISALVLPALAVSAHPAAAPLNTLIVCKTGCSYTSIQAAVSAAQNGDVIQVAEGEYVEKGQIFIQKNLTLTASDPLHPPTIKPGQNTGQDGDQRGWFLVKSKVAFQLDHVILDGVDFSIFEAIRSHGTLTLNNTTIRNIRYALFAYDTLPGGTGIYLDSTGNAISHNSFSNIGRAGVMACGAASLTFDNNTYTGKGGLPQSLDYAVWLAGGATASLTGNFISNNKGQVGSDKSAGVRVDTASILCPSTKASSATLLGNQILNSQVGIQVGSSAADLSTIVAHGNRIFGNLDAGLLASTSQTVQQDARSNWWGCNAGPQAALCDQVVGSNVNFAPNLAMTLDVQNPLLKVGQSTLVTAVIADATAKIPDGVQVAFTANLGSINPNDQTQNGLAQVTYTANGGVGTATVAAALDNQSVSQEITIEKQITRLILPVLYSNFQPFRNGQFSDGWNGWSWFKGGFNGNGTGGPLAVGSQPALLGDPNLLNGQVPVGYGALSQGFTVEKPYLDVQFDFATHDIGLGGDNQYFDTFEISINLPPAQVTDAQRAQVGCHTPSSSTQTVNVAAAGLVYCAGGNGSVGTLVDFGLSSLRLNLQNFTGQNVTVYLALWQREYNAPYTQDRGYYNTWVTIHSVLPGQ